MNVWNYVIFYAYNVLDIFNSKYKDGYFMYSFFCLYKPNLLKTTSLIVSFCTWIYCGICVCSGMINFIIHFTLPCYRKTVFNIAICKRNVEFHHSIRNASRIWRKVGNDSVLMGTEYLTIRLKCSPRLPWYSEIINTLQYIMRPVVAQGHKVWL